MYILASRLWSARCLIHTLTLTRPTGYHPWFTHWIAVEPIISKEAHYRALFLPPSPPPKAEHVSTFERLLPLLPDPTPLAEVLADLHENLTAFPHAMLGEVGLDRVCRIPYSRPAEPPYAEHADARELSPFTIPLAHQVKVLEAQLDLAVRLRRNVSLHSVKCAQATSELLDRMEARYPDEWLKISVDLHSCGLSAQGWTAISVGTYLLLSTILGPCPWRRSFDWKLLFLLTDSYCAHIVISTTCRLLPRRRATPRSWIMDAMSLGPCPSVRGRSLT